MSHNCQICNNKQNLKYYNVKEQMMGTGDIFQYFQCTVCGCLQIAEIPNNLADYYGQGYYSFNVKKNHLHPSLRQWADKQRVKAVLFKHNYIGSCLNKLSKPLEYVSWLSDETISFDSAILDIGCGEGRLLLRMARGGFTNLTGIDPFIEESIAYSNGVKIYREDLYSFTKQKHEFDLIMLHHSFEHMPDQKSSFHCISKLLKPNGVIILRIPLSDSFAWEHYKENWVQLDAPRHLFLHTKRSLKLLMEENNLIIKKTIYDSSKFQFTGSELYCRGIPLNASKKERNIFSKKELKNFDLEATRLNNEMRGDQAIFYICHKK